jgi:hypothetical protein
MIALRKAMETGMSRLGAQTGSSFLSRFAPALRSGVGQLGSMGAANVLLEQADKWMPEWMGNLPVVGREGWVGQNILGLDPIRGSTNRSVEHQINEAFPPTYEYRRPGPGAGPGTPKFVPRTGYDTSHGPLGWLADIYRPGSLQMPTGNPLENPINFARSAYTPPPILGRTWQGLQLMSRPWALGAYMGSTARDAISAYNQAGQVAQQQTTVQNPHLEASMRQLEAIPKEQWTPMNYQEYYNLGRRLGRW